MFLVLLPAACRWPCCLTSSSLCLCRHTWHSWLNPGFSSSICKRGRAVFPEEGNNGKRAIIQWFDLALTASDPDSQCSEVKNEKLFFHRSQNNCKEKKYPASLKQVGRCSCLGCSSPAITSSRQPYLESSQKMKALGVFVWQRDPAPTVTASAVHLQESHPFASFSHHKVISRTYLNQSFDFSGKN